MTEAADTAVTDQGKEAAVRRYKNELYVDAVPEDTEYIDVPFIYYKGYAAEKANDRTGLSVTGEGHNGRVRVYTAGTGKIHVYYKGTMLQHVGDIVSAGALVCIILYFLIPAIRKRKGSETGK